MSRVEDDWDPVGPGSKGKGRKREGGGKGQLGEVHVKVRKLENRLGGGRLGDMLTHR